MVVEINPAGKKEEESLHLGQSSLYNSIVQKVQQLHGDFGAAAIRAGFVAKYCNEKTRTAIIRVRHGPHVFVTSSIPCINTIENKQVVVNTLYIGATIRQCQKFLLNYQQNKFEEFCAGLKTNDEKLAMKEALNLDHVMEMT